MKTFHSAREAKEFLISRIVAEAQRENVPLSDVERKMLYFSETGWTLPDIAEVNDAFEGEYDSGKYERKIAKLIRNADKHTRKESSEEYRLWWSAIRTLTKEDHYILVMVRIAGVRPAGDLLRLLGTSLAVISCMMLFVFLRIRYDSTLSKYLPSRDAFWFFVWLLGACALAAYLLVGLAIGTKRRNDIVSKGLEALVQIYQRFQ
ncbi:MAG: hypothetical protein WCF22_01955 [Candidatus Sulfotelmatobacter sp.]